MQTDRLLGTAVARMVLSSKITELHYSHSLRNGIYSFLNAQNEFSEFSNCLYTNWVYGGWRIQKIKKEDISHKSQVLETTPVNTFMHLFLVLFSFFFVLLFFMH